MLQRGGLPPPWAGHLQLSGARLTQDFGYEVFGELDWSPGPQAVLLCKSVSLSAREASSKPDGG